MAKILGATLIAGKRSTFKFGMNGSGNFMFRGNADKIKLRICTQGIGMMSQNEKW